MSNLSGTRRYILELIPSLPIPDGSWLCSRSRTLAGPLLPPNKPKDESKYWRAARESRAAREEGENGDGDERRNAKKPPPGKIRKNVTDGPRESLSFVLRRKKEEPAAGGRKVEIGWGKKGRIRGGDGMLVTRKKLKEPTPWCGGLEPLPVCASLGMKKPGKRRKEKERKKKKKAREREREREPGYRVQKESNRWTKNRRNRDRKEKEQKECVCVCVCVCVCSKADKRIGRGEGVECAYLSWHKFISRPKKLGMTPASLATVSWDSYYSTLLCQWVLRWRRVRISFALKLILDFKDCHA